MQPARQRTANWPSPASSVGNTRVLDSTRKFRLNRIYCQASYRPWSVPNSVRKNAEAQLCGQLNRQIAPELPIQPAACAGSRPAREPRIAGDAQLLSIQRARCGTVGRPPDNRGPPYNGVGPQRHRPASSGNSVAPSVSSFLQGKVS